MLNFDLRDNPSITKKLLKVVSLLLIRNIDIANKQKLNCNSKWVKRDVLNLTKLEFAGLTQTLFDNKTLLTNTSAVNLEIKKTPRLATSASSTKVATRNQTP